MDLGIAGERAPDSGAAPKGWGLSAAGISGAGGREGCPGRPGFGYRRRSLPGRLPGGPNFLKAILATRAFARVLPAAAAQTLGGAISILIYQCRRGHPPVSFHENTPGPKWRATFELNLFGHVEIAQLLIPGMSETWIRPRR